MNMNATLKPILRGSFKKKNGSHSIYLRLTINRKTKYYKVGLTAKNEDLYKFQFKFSVKNSALKNMKLNESVTRVQQILNDFIKLRFKYQMQLI